MSSCTYGIKEDLIYEQKTIHTLQHAPYTEREDQFESNESNIKRLSIDASVYTVCKELVIWLKSDFESQTIQLQFN